MRPIIGLLIPPSDRPPPPPEQLPIGRAALALRDTITVVFGDRVEAGTLDGHVARDGSWESVSLRPHAVIDRYPSFSRPREYQRLLVELGAIPVFNPPRLTALLRDKLRTQDALYGLGMPEVVSNPTRFGAALERWDAGFVKPRFGSFGRGVRRVTEAPAARGIVDRVDQPMVLQRAVRPPDAYAGVALRILVQRLPSGAWHAYPPVARHHPSDPVVNRARGAEVTPAEDLFGSGVAKAAMKLATTVGERFPGAIELGVDAVLSRDAIPYLIEVNARPRGRLHALAATWPDRFGDLHDRACRTPFETVAAAYF